VRVYSRAEELIPWVKSPPAVGHRSDNDPSMSWHIEGLFCPHCRDDIPFVTTNGERPYNGWSFYHTHSSLDGEFVRVRCDEHVYLAINHDGIGLVTPEQFSLLKERENERFPEAISLSGL